MLSLKCFCMAVYPTVYSSSSIISSLNYPVSTSTKVAEKTKPRPPPTTKTQEEPFTSITSEESLDDSQADKNYENSEKSTESTSSQNSVNSEESDENEPDEIFQARIASEPIVSQNITNKVPKLRISRKIQPQITEKFKKLSKPAENWRDIQSGSNADQSSSKTKITNKNNKTPISSPKRKKIQLPTPSPPQLPSPQII